MTKATSAVSASACIDNGPAAGDRVNRAISVTQSQPSTPPDGCYRCQQELYISFFFDGFGQTLNDIDHLSNVARLFNAHKTTDKEKGVYKLYYEGMGRRLSKERISVAASLAKNTVDKAKEFASDKVTEAGKDAAKTTGKEVFADAQSSGVGAAVKSSILHATESTKEAYKPSTLASGVISTIKDPSFIVSTLVSIGSESFPGIRDSEIAAAYLGTGFDARVEAALDDFAEVVKQAKSDTRPLKTIRVAVFGYDRGAIVARKFANELIEKKCKKDGEKVTYQGAEVTFDFMGLFDSVSSAYADSIFTKVLAPVLNFVPGEGWLARVGIKGISMIVGLAKQSLGEFDTPGEFRKIVHHVAATELRFYKQLDSPRNSKEAGNLTEIVYPGSQSDVGGGFREHEDGKSSELALVSARNMMDQAWSYGVPIRRLEELKQPKTIDIYSQLQFSKKIEIGGKFLTANDLFGAYTAILPSGKNTLEHQFLAHQMLFISWARTVYNRTQSVSKGDNLFVNTIDADVYNEIFSGNATPDFQTRADYYRSQSAGAGSAASGFGGRPQTVDDIPDPVIKQLATAWVKPQALSPEVVAFFDNFVHNTITRLNNVSLGDGVFMQLRTIEDKSRKDQVVEKAKDKVSKKVDSWLPHPDQLRSNALQKLGDAQAWSQGSQRYADPLGLN
ncbi:hypothetical protein LMG28688_07157 [Paraburkholderia caffeinitolerans]|uniref:T6SS Phospholipase effector Tle1-like catalytic domain-containing protein n=1 Tax=Paraburkholderia caffeinitolerans TaxID=1723730 RepID=A0A6J5H2H7_9BURK|nr:DUF2235 domain-containing protein [Paraburkholderia caffeinitolerans]CAB3810108.1 hypothetical protein LMG28688_07157 [Paraburkholderia caffeinitolerans]